MEQFRDGNGSSGGRGGSGGGPGGPIGGGGLPGGCLFGRMRIGAMAEEDGLHDRPPIQSVAALGLLIAVVCILAFWFLAR